MRVSVPGNLLLLGEYAVTLPGGLGVSFAIDRFVTIDIKESDTLTMTSTQDDHRLIRFILDEMGWTKPLSIHVDSRDFYDEKGQKKGFGSSAAVTVGLVYGLLGKSKEEVFPLALDIHRAFQGGRGSGYDVMTSLYGGMGLFCGGEKPKWTPLNPSWNEASLLRGDAAVSSTDALSRFDNLERKAQFFRVSNQVVEQFVKTKNLKQIARARTLHRWVHRQLGIVAESPLLETFTGPRKSLGAGGEIAIVFEEENSQLLEKVSLSTEGVRCL